MAHTTEAAIEAGTSRYHHGIPVEIAERIWQTLHAKKQGRFYANQVDAKQDPDAVLYDLLTARFIAAEQRRAEEVARTKANAPAPTNTPQHG